jgi:hypothetical protein
MRQGTDPSHWRQAPDGARWYLPEAASDAGSPETERRFPVMIFEDRGAEHPFRVLLVPSLEPDEDFGGPWSTLEDAVSAAEVLALHFLRPGVRRAGLLFGRGAARAAAASVR